MWLYLASRFDKLNLSKHSFDNLFTLSRVTWFKAEHNVDPITHYLSLKRSFQQDLTSKSFDFQYSLTWVLIGWG